MRLHIVKAQREEFESACAALTIEPEIYTDEKTPALLLVILPDLDGLTAWNLCLNYQLNVRDVMVNKFLE